jgi:hypothetical protein
MREVRPGNVQSSWSSARSEQEFRIRSLVAVPHAQQFAFWFDVLDAFDLEIDAKVAYGMPGDGQSIVPKRALEIVLREKGPVIWLLALF